MPVWSGYSAGESSCSPCSTVSPGSSAVARVRYGSSASRPHGGSRPGLLRRDAGVVPHLLAVPPAQACLERSVLTYDWSARAAGVEAEMSLTDHVVDPAAPSSWRWGPLMGFQSLVQAGPPGSSY